MVQPTNLRSPTSQQSGTPQGGAQMGIQGTGNVNDLPLTMTSIGAITFPQTIIEPNPQGTKEDRFKNVLMRAGDGKREVRRATRGDLLLAAYTTSHSQAEPEAEPATKRIVIKTTPITATAVTSGNFSKITITDTTPATSADKMETSPKPSDPTPSTPIPADQEDQGINLHNLALSSFSSLRARAASPKTGFVKVFSLLADSGKLASTKDFNPTEGKVDPKKTINTNMGDLVNKFFTLKNPIKTNVEQFKISFLQWCLCQNGVINARVSDGILTNSVIAGCVVELTDEMVKQAKLTQETSGKPTDRDKKSKLNFQPPASQK